MGRSSRRARRAAGARLFRGVRRRRVGLWAQRKDLIVARIRQIGVDRILYGSDGAAGPGRSPREAWQSFTELPLSDAEIRTVAGNVAPYMR